MFLSFLKLITQAVNISMLKLKILSQMTKAELLQWCINFVHSLKMCKFTQVYFHKLRLPIENPRSRHRNVDDQLGLA